MADAVKISKIDALEILDSRGNPTVRATVTLDSGISAQASVPSGASTGENEAVELRDADPKRYGGKGVLHAVANVKDKIGPAVVGMDATDQRGIDDAMIKLDGTPNKAQLGANAILGVSMAAARAAAVALGQPLYRYLAKTTCRRMPVPCMNILNGGAHSDNSVDFQEFMVAAIGAPSYPEGLRYNVETFHTLKGILHKRGLATSVGDEGGFAPDLGSNEEAAELIVEAIEAAGYRPGEDIAICIDSAATSFAAKTPGNYDLKWSGGGHTTREQLIDLAGRWIAKYPIVLWEDPLAEDDWEGFRQFTERFGKQIEVVGDDIFVTNTRYIRRGIEEKCANASLIKLNQIGTVSETLDAVALCRKAGWRTFLSHRSGETTDTFLADLAVATACGQLKSGSACRGERLAKYNRLLEINAELGDTAEYYW